MSIYLSEHDLVLFWSTAYPSPLKFMLGFSWSSSSEKIDYDYEQRELDSTSISGMNKSAEFYSRIGMKFNFLLPGEF